MNQAKEAATVHHEMTATVQLNADCDPVDHRSGHFGSEDDPLAYSIIPQPGRKVHLVFYAQGGTDAIMTVHKLMQRHARGASRPENYRKKRAKYGAGDYKIIEIVHPGTKEYDLPRGENPDLSPKPRVKPVETMEMQLS